MCVDWIGDWHTATEDITTYKIVRQEKSRKSEDRFRSATRSNSRILQTGIGTCSGYGKMKIYKLEVASTAPNPGIYCLASLQQAKGQIQTWQRNNPDAHFVLLEVLIPARTKIRYGSTLFDHQTINARKIVPVRVV